MTGHPSANTKGVSFDMVRKVRIWPRVILDHDSMICETFSEAHKKLPEAAV